MLEIEIRHAPFQRRSIRRPRPDGVAGPQPQQERIRKSAPAMELNGQIEFFTLYGSDERLDGGRVFQS
ncbi:MAG TPA: hypothetical protein VK883_14670, partial [Arthrobacter sp.]|nr:hypothetical protein [Arthrobacter sp.]